MDNVDNRQQELTAVVREIRRTQHQIDSLSERLIALNRRRLDLADRLGIEVAEDAKAAEMPHLEWSSDGLTRGHLSEACETILRRGARAMTVSELVEVLSFAGRPMTGNAYRTIYAALTRNPTRFRRDGPGRFALLASMRNGDESGDL